MPMCMLEAAAKSHSYNVNKVTYVRAVAGHVTCKATLQRHLLAAQAGSI